MSKAVVSLFRSFVSVFVSYQASSLTLVISKKSFMCQSVIFALYCEESALSMNNVGGEHINKERDLSS